MLLFVVSLFGFHGIIENDTTWSDTAYLTGDVWINPDVTLTIDPGTVVLYADSCKWDTVWEKPSSYFWEITDEGKIDLVIEGDLKAHGSVDDSISFLQTGEGYLLGRGTVIFSSGYDSLSFCSFIASDKILLDKPCVFYNDADVFISNSHFFKGLGLWGFDSHLHIDGCVFDSVQVHPVSLEGGSLLVESSSFTNTRWLGSYFHCQGVINGTGLYSYQVRDVEVDIAVGAWEKLSGGSAAACYCESCHFVEILKSSFKRVVGGFGEPSMGCGGCGGTGYGVYLENCHDILIQNNLMQGIYGGDGEDNIEDCGYGGNAIGVLIRDCENVTVEKNNISHLVPGKGLWHPDDEQDGHSWAIWCRNSTPKIFSNVISSDGIYIYIDSNSQPLIGGIPDQGNTFMGAGEKYDYVIYNNSPYNIDARYNTWQCNLDMIDSLIFDYYDDSTKGIVHYEHATDVTEPEQNNPPPICQMVGSQLSVNFGESLSNPVKITIFDVAGRSAYSAVVTESQTFHNLSALARGVYFVSIKNENNQIYNERILIY